MTSVRLREQCKNHTEKNSVEPSNETEGKCPRKVCKTPGFLRAISDLGKNKEKNKGTGNEAYIATKDKQNSYADSHQECPSAVKNSLSDLRSYRQEQPSSSQGTSYNTGSVRLREENEETQSRKNLARHSNQTGSCTPFIQPKDRQQSYTCQNSSRENTWFENKNGLNMDRTLKSSKKNVSVCNNKYGDSPSITLHQSSSISNSDKDISESTFNEKNCPQNESNVVKSNNIKDRFYSGIQDSGRNCSEYNPNTQNYPLHKNISMKSGYVKQSTGVIQDYNVSCSKSAPELLSHQPSKNSIVKNGSDWQKNVSTCNDKTQVGRNVKLHESSGIWDSDEDISGSNSIEKKWSGTKSNSKNNLSAGIQDSGRNCSESNPNTQNYPLHKNINIRNGNIKQSTSVNYNVSCSNSASELIHQPSKNSMIKSDGYRQKNVSICNDKTRVGPRVNLPESSGIWDSDEDITGSTSIEKKWPQTKSNVKNNIRDNLTVGIQDSGRNCSESNSNTQNYPLHKNISMKSGYVKQSTSVIQDYNDSNFEASSSISEEEDVAYHPEQIEAINLYLQKIESVRSVDVKLADRIVKDLNELLKCKAPGNTVYLYGSYRSGLAISTSNLNLALKPNQAATNKFLLYVQKLFYSELCDYHVFPLEEDTNNVKRSKICFSEPKSGITCELVYFSSNFFNSRELDSLLQMVCVFDHRIKTLIFAARIWAEVCLIHDPENGTLHPLGFILLVIHFVQQIEPPVLPILDISSKDLGLNLEKKNLMSVGELWLEFLKYYSHNFNWKSHVVAIDCKEHILKGKKGWDHSWIAIEDPYSLKNVGESVATYESADCIFSCFKTYYEYFSSPTIDGDSDSEETELSSKKWKYSFNKCNFQQVPMSFCEKCDELDDVCEKCQHTPLPSLEKLPTLSESSMKCMSDVLTEVYNESILPDAKIEGRRAFIRDLETYIRKIYADVKLTLFGSSVNKFGFKHSDLDICMTFTKMTVTSSCAVQVLRFITRHLRKNANYENVIALYTAQIPVVKFHFPYQKWNCDLSLNNVLAVHNSVLLSKYALMDNRCRILGSALKVLARKCCIADSSLRSLSSYSYILMVIHYLQQTEPPVLPVIPIHDKKVFDLNVEVPSEVLKGQNFWYYEDANQLKQRYGQTNNTCIVGELWLGLLEYYLTYDNSFAITITEKENVLSSTLQKCARLFNIEDPFLSGRNLGCIISEEKAYQTMKVFRSARSFFGSDTPKEKMIDAKSYYFSSSNLTGRFIKEVECDLCGAFGHEGDECVKANPFKKFRTKFRNPNPYRTKR